MAEQKRVETMTAPGLVVYIKANGLSDLSASALNARYKGELRQIAQGGAR